MSSKLEFSYLGTLWGPSGDLFYMTRSNGDQARVYVDSLGELWVTILRVPEGGYFHTKTVESYRVDGGPATAERGLREQDFDRKRNASGADRVYPKGT